MAYKNNKYTAPSEKKINLGNRIRKKCCPEYCTSSVEN